MEPVVTKDGTTTFFNAQFNEHYHCLAGALAEAEIKHVLPAKEYISTNAILLDFCFGLGYNTLAALAYAEKKGITNLTIYALESDSEIIKKIKDIAVPDELVAIRDAVANLSEHTTVRYKSHTIVLLLGDAKEMLADVPSDCAVVFYDPFSPKTQPELWTKELFADIYAKMKSESVLTTYSCARHVREKMHSAGFVVTDGPVFGRKSPSTLAHKE